MAHELLIACAWKGMLILVAAGALDFCLRKASAAARSLLWSAAFLALLILPLLSLSLPRSTARVPQAIPPAAPRISVTVTPQVAQSPNRSPLDLALFGWLCGAVIVIGRFGIGTVRVWLLARRARPMDLAGWSLHVPVLDAGRGAAPVAWGWLRPVILFPSEARDWPAGRVRSVLLHELAHIERKDCLTLAIVELALAVYWFQPLAWWAAARLRRERERACDDFVLAAGVRASDYADDLLAVARSRSDVLAAPAMAASSNLETRLRAIFDPVTRRTAVSARVARLATVGAILATIPLAPLRIAAQNEGLSGIVYDVSGGVIPGATVSVVSPGGQPVSVSTAADGAYSFTNLPSGRYQLTISKPGFELYARQPVQSPGHLNAVLSLGQITESVTVAGKGSPTPPGSPRRIRVGGNVQAARLIEGPKPLYPVNAESAGIEGTVLLRAVVTMDGSVSGLSVLSSPNETLTGAAMDAVRRWRYEPTLLNGKPVEVVTTVAVSFRLTP